MEDVMQQAYINAFTHLDQFEERAASHSMRPSPNGERSKGRNQWCGSKVELDDERRGFQAPRCDRVVTAVLARIAPCP